MNLLENKTGLKKITHMCDLIFKIEFLIFGFASFNAYTYGRSVMSLFVILSTFLAGVSLLARMINYKNYIRNMFLWILGLFVISYIVTTLINIDNGFMVPLKTLVWMVIQYCLVFAMDNSKTVEENKKDFTIVSFVYSGYMFIAAIISITQAILHIGTSTRVDFDTYHEYVNSGLVWGRLWGVFTDPNYGSVMAVVALLFSIYYLYKFKNKVIRILSIINIVFQVLLISLSDSRTGLVSLALSLAILVLLIAVRKPINPNRNNIKRISIIVLEVVLVAASATFVPKCTKLGYNAVIKAVYQDDNIDDDQDDDEYLIGREGDLTGDFSNRRLDIWKSGAELFKTAPIFGISFNNTVKYAKQHCPNTYLINNDHGEYNNFHNMYINILVGQGIVGFIIIILFTISVALFILTKFFKNKVKENDFFLAVLISVIVAVGTSTVFLSEAIYVNSANATMFWLSLGFCCFYFKTENKNIEHK